MLVSLLFGKQNVALAVLEDHTFSNTPRTETCLPVPETEQQDVHCRLAHLCGTEIDARDDLLGKPSIGHFTFKCSGWMALIIYTIFKGAHKKTIFAYQVYLQF